MNNDVKNGEWYKIQFIKNLKGNYCTKSFRKYNVIEAWFNKDRQHWVHYTEFGIHFIPAEYVKIYKH